MRSSSSDDYRECYRTKVVFLCGLFLWSLYEASQSQSYVRFLSFQTGLQ
jgi:hypothetical protein